VTEQRSFFNRPHWTPRETAGQLVAIPRYLRVIGVSKILIGVLVIALIAVVIIMPLLNKDDNGMRIVFNKLPVSQDVEKPKMVNPRFESVDAENQPFTIRAREAVQHDVDSVLLTGLEADIALNQGNWLALQAEQGLLQIGNKKMLLQGKVHIFSDDGNEITTERVFVKLDTGDAWGPEPVQAQGAIGTISAGSFQLSPEKKAIRFSHGVKLVLYP
jgi:hypothetical protein